MPPPFVNRATHEIFRLPGSSPISVSICQLLFDPSPKWGVHKVLIVSHQGSAVDAKIFTLGVDRSWRSLEGAIPAAACCSSTVSLPCVNGAIHWLAEIFKIVDETADGLQPEILPTDFVAQRYGSESIVAFNIREERFRQLAYPNCCYGGDFCGGMHDVYFFEIGGFLYFLHFDVSNAILNIWVLKDYVEEKWIREYRIDSESLRKELHLADHFHFVKQLSIRNMNENQEGLASKVAEAIIVKLRDALEKKSNEYNETESKLNSALEEVKWDSKPLEILLQATTGDFRCNAKHPTVVSEPSLSNTICRFTHVSAKAETEEAIFKLLVWGGCLPHGGTTEGARAVKEEAAADGVGASEEAAL
ncbi:hypothetical protein EJ110_NYTH22423 [Nymphaea thermarum]|nr:hypothetical protein EJ110_NYTH22423 [Nymphaea thermarum]